MKNRGIRGGSLALALLPMTARASFGAAPCGDDFACHFIGWGVLLGTMGVPIACIIFALLHVVSCHPQRSKPRQALAGAIIGLLGYEVSAAAGSLAAAAGHSFLAGFVPVICLLAAGSFVFARSAPRK